MSSTTRLSLGCVLLLAIWTSRTSTASQATTLDETIAPGTNYDKADFRLWLPTARLAVVIGAPFVKTTWLS